MLHEKNVREQIIAYEASPNITPIRRTRLQRACSTDLHRLTQIHAFPNGNGRHARMMADLLVERLGGQVFSWGGGSLADVGTLRERYVSALKAADGHDIESLLGFIRSWWPGCWRGGREALLHLKCPQHWATSRCEDNKTDREHLLPFCYPIR